MTVKETRLGVVGTQCNIQIAYYRIIHLKIMFLTNVTPINIILKTLGTGTPTLSGLQRFDDTTEWRSRPLSAQDRSSTR